MGAPFLSGMVEQIMNLFRRQCREGLTKTPARWRSAYPTRKMTRDGKRGAFTAWTWGELIIYQIKDWRFAKFYSFNEEDLHVLFAMMTNPFYESGEKKLDFVKRLVNKSIKLTTKLEYHTRLS